VELLVVLLILGVISSVTLPSYITSVYASREEAANANARELELAVLSKAVNTGSFDTSVADYALELGGSIPVNPCSGTTTTGYVISADSSTATVSAAVGTLCGDWTPQQSLLEL
jgi:type II secretory pathway pseudopilin PulG